MVIIRDWRECFSRQEIAKITSFAEDILDELQNHYDFPEWGPCDDEKDYFVSWLLSAVKAGEFSTGDFNIVRRGCHLQGLISKLVSVA